MAGWLAGLDRADLARLLANRPEVLLAPEPRSLTELSQRLGGSPASLVAALRVVPVPCVQIVEALTALGDSASLNELTELLADASGPTPHADLVAHWLNILSDHGIVWIEAGNLLGSAAALTAIFPSPLGLGPPLRALLPEISADAIRRVLKAVGVAKPPTRRADLVADLLRVLVDPEAVRRISQTAPSAVTQELLAWANESGSLPNSDDYFGATDDGFEDEDEDEDEADFVGSVYDPTAYARRRAAATWAIERGLVFGRPWDGGWQMPAEVSRALQGPQFRAPFTGAPPTVNVKHVDPGYVATQSAVAVSRFADLTLALLDRLARTSLPALKSGGVGARELAKLGKAMGGEEAEIRLVLELCAAVDVIEIEAGRWQLSSQAESWRSSQPADRVAAMLIAWWNLPSAATRSRDRDGKTTPALAAARCVGCLLARQNLFHCMAELGEHQAGDPSELARRALWLRPFVHVLSQDARQPFGSVFTEANTLGVVALGALTELGRALVTGQQEGVRKLLVDALPAANDRALFGPDLTVVVTGAPTWEVSRLLDAAADRESRGGATVWRFTPGSIRRALDEGSSAASLEDGLAAIATGELPQSLRYLIGDVGRRHGGLKVASVVSIVRSDDEALLRQVAADRALRKLGLRLLAPTVLGADVDGDTVLATLRTAGYLPVPDADSTTAGPSQPGQVKTWLETERLAPVVQLRPRTNRQIQARVDPDTLAARLLAQPIGQSVASSPTERQLSAAARRLSASEIQILVHAVEHGTPVVIDYQSQSGNMTHREITPRELSGSTILAWCGFRGDERWFRVDRIHSVVQPS